MTPTKLRAGIRWGGFACPPAAALLDAGGLWTLYRTDLFRAAERHPLLGAAVEAHMLASGPLFTFAVCRLDPVRFRWGPGLRRTALMGAGTAHAVLAKTLYVTRPPGSHFTAAGLRPAPS